MKAMVLERARTPLKPVERATPVPGPGEVLIKVKACGVCRTDLHILDGELAHPKLPLVLGHEIVGQVAMLGPGVEGFARGARVGVPWLGRACGHCGFCMRGRENLCEGARFTGYDIDGGYADYALADARFVFPLPAAYGDAEAAPLLCAGLIGYRTLRRADEHLGDKAMRLGIYGFGAAAHIIAQVARAQGRELYAFTRPGDRRCAEFCAELGRGVGRRLGRDAAEASRCRAHLRALGRARAAGACAP